MSWIDTERAGTLATAWVAGADDLARFQADVELDLDRLALGTVQSSAVQLIASAATELWVDGAFLRLVVEAAESADAEFDAARLVQLRRRAGDRVRVSITDACLAPWMTPTYSSAFGDLGGTHGAEVRSPFAAFGATPDVRGRSAVARALADTASATQIREDEFELVSLVNGRYLVVLPGVIDLSSPHLGLDDDSRSVRDLDLHAYPSSRSTLVADNEYARMVWEALEANGVPTGAELMIVGHSFGADTALDLAADRNFNGPEGYRVTHVVAAGYYSDPQLDAVDVSTEVLVLQNHRDAAVIAEAVGHGNLTDAVEETRAWWDAVRDLDVPGAWSNGTSAVGSGAASVWDGVGYTVANSDDLGQIADGVMMWDLDSIRDGASDFVTIDPRVDEVATGHVIDVFVGGGEGFGHHPNNYIEHINNTDELLLRRFFESVDAAGYTEIGTSLAIDVSVPQEQP